MDNKRINKLIQVGMVVGDLYRSMDEYIKLGIGPWYVLEFNPSNVKKQTLYGKKKKYSMNIGVCPIGPIRFELIEPLSDSIYEDFLSEYGNNLIHHLKWEVKSYANILDFFKLQEIENIQSGHQKGIEGENVFNYLDTFKEFGFITEIVDVSDDFIKPKPESWYPDKDFKYKSIFTRPSLLGIIVRDLGYTLKRFEELLNLKPYRTIDLRSDDLSDLQAYKNLESYNTKQAYIKIGNIDLKLIEPCGDSIFKDYLRKCGPNNNAIIHHIKMDVPEYSKATEALEALSFKKLLSATYEDKTELSYFDTTPLNFITLIAENKDQIIP